jgi:hypothetical protein
MYYEKLAAATAVPEFKNLYKFSATFHCLLYALIFETNLI